jgi:hypothetical protein
LKKKIFKFLVTQAALFLIGYIIQKITENDESGNQISEKRNSAVKKKPGKTVKKRKVKNEVSEIS